MKTASDQRAGNLWLMFVGLCAGAIALGWLTGCEYRPVVGPDGGGDEPRQLAVIMIDETEELFPGRGEYRTSKVFHDALDAKGHVWRYGDKDVLDPNRRPPADLAPFIEDSRGEILPRVYLCDLDTGECLWSGDAPERPAHLLDIIDRYDGG